MISLGQRLRVFDAFSLIYGTSCYLGFGDAYFPRWDDKNREWMQDE